MFITKDLNVEIKKYIKKYTVHYEDEPVLISSEIFKIFQKLKQEWKNLDLIYSEPNMTISPYATSSIPQPDLLEKSKKHGTIMLEMDMFSARKKHIFSGLGLDRYSTFLSLELMIFKSLYELIRKIRITPKAFEQLHADI